MHDYVAPKQIEEIIKMVEYSRLGEKTTICFITLVNGFEMVGASACIDPFNFKKEVGKYFAYKDAVDKLETYEAYKLQHELYRQQEIKMKGDD